MSFRIPSERFRLTTGPMGSDPGTPAGAFLLDSCEPGWLLAIVCDDGRAPGADATGWAHVSVRAHRKRYTVRGGKTIEDSRVPTWREMCLVKALCWQDEDVVMQLHPARSAYVNQHPHVLHLWEPLDVAIPVPPVSCV